MATHRAASAAGSGGGVGAAPPGDRQTLLSQVAPERKRIYEQVREILDELERAAPWTLLYYPPDEKSAFLDLVQALLGVVEGIPDRLQGLISSMEEGCDEPTRQALEDAQFYFYGIHSMVASEVDRIRGRASAASSASAQTFSAADRNLLSALTADLKGKYGSALMGATASIVAEGNWTGVATEPVLFPEKADEFRRNEELVASLGELLETIRRLPAAVDFAGLQARWRQGSKADQYALTELAAFRAVLGRPLKSDHRRALYSGDYQQIQQRETQLSERISELETLHRRLWEHNLPASKAAGTFARLCQVGLEIAAVIDVHLLEQLVGAEAVQRLRVVVTAESQEEEQQGLDSPGRQSLSPELRPLVPLLAEEDLRTFVELLLGAVRKRASFSLPAAASVPAEEAPELLEELELEPLEPSAPSTAAAPALLSPPPPPEPEVVAPEPPTTQTHEGSRAPTLSAAQRLEAVEELRRILAELQAPGNAQWAALRMLQRLMAKHSRVPPSMVQSSHPFLFEILNTLVPQLEVVASFGGVPADTRQKLVSNCMELSRPNLSPEQMLNQVPLALNRLVRLLEALTAVSGGLARSLRQEELNA